MNNTELTEEQKAYAAFVYILHQVYAVPYHNEALIQRIMDLIRRKENCLHFCRSKTLYTVMKGNVRCEHSLSCV